MAKRLNGPLRVAIYARVSSDEQASKDFSSINVQEVVCRRFIEGNGYTFAGFYSDEARTGTSLARPGFKRMLGDAQARRFDAVAVTYLSRLGRGRAYHNAEYELQKTQINVLTVEERFSDDFFGQMNKETMIFVGGVFPRLISMETRTKQRQMVERGFYTGGTVPYGFESVLAEDGAGFRSADKQPPRRLVPAQGQAPFVLRAYELFRDTGGSYARVRDYLNSVTIRQWSLNTTISLLKREAYCGVLQFGSSRNEHAFESVVPRELWDECQAIQRTRIRAPKADPVDKSSFYLRSILHCAHCGTRLTPANHHGRTARVRYYECIAAGKRTQACPVKRVNADSIHAAVLEHVRRVAAHPTRCAEVIRDAIKAMPTPEKMDTEQVAINRRVREVEKRIKNVMTAIEAGTAGVRSLINRLQELETERAEAVQQKQQLEAQIAETKIQRPDAAMVQAWFADFLRLWEAATEEERQRLMPLIVDRVEMHEKEHGFCRLSFTMQNPRSMQFSTSKNVVINCSKGAGAGLEPATFGL